MRGNISGIHAAVSSTVDVYFQYFEWLQKSDARTLQFVHHQQWRFLISIVPFSHGE